MKKLFAILPLALLLFACNNSAKTGTAQPDTATVTEDVPVVAAPAAPAQKQPVAAKKEEPAPAVEEPSPAAVKTAPAPATVQTEKAARPDATVEVSEADKGNKSNVNKKTR